jgi:hypothetical protein
MELIEAAKNQDVERVKVLRPLEAVSGTEYGPSRAVCLGLGQWTLDAVVARPIRPCCAESTHCVRRRSGKFDVACRRSSGKVRTPRSVTRTLPCRIAESHNFSPPPSPAIAVSAISKDKHVSASFARNRRFRDFLKFGTFGGCASGERDGEYSESSLCR